MAAPLSADRLLAALRAEGVRVAERSGWRTHNRNSKGPWSDLNGVVIHHTAGRDSLALCWTGTAALPGPLCHTHLSKSGVATMVGYGRTNHAGTFAQNAFDAMRDEATVHPRPDVAEPVDANARTYGIEIENLGDGKDPYPDGQYDAAVRWAAAICRAYGWSADSVIGHKEGTRRKIDPSFSMDAFRAAVEARLAHTPDWDPNEEDDVPTAAEIAAEVAKLLPAALWASDTAPAARPPWNNSDYFEADGKTLKNTTWTGGYMQRTQVEGIRETLARVKEMGARPPVELSDEDIATLASAVAGNAALAELIAEKVAVKLAERLAE